MNDEFGKENVFFFIGVLKHVWSSKELDKIRLGQMRFIFSETPLLGIAGNIFHVLSYQDKRTVEQVQAELRAKKKQKLQVISF